MQVNVPDKLVSSFENLSDAVYNTIVWYGGRGSGKSQALACIGIMESYIDDGVILCCREIQKSIDDSIYSMLKSHIEEMKLGDDFVILNNSITNIRTGAKFIFAGLKNNVTSIKSINKLRVVLVDEAENVSQNSWDILQPTPRYGKTRIYVVFNPRFEIDPTYQEFVAKDDDKKLVININWRDNPWFPDSLNDVRLRDAKGDAGRYNWIWEGQFLTITDASIFAKKMVSREFHIDDSFGNPYIGVDWGFSNDPTAVIECYVKDNTLYISACGSKIGLELDDTADWLIKHVPNIKHFVSFADNARPETISKVKRSIPLIKPCEKGKGSVEDGVAFIQSFDAIIVHPNAIGCYSELASYSYAKDKHDEITTKILDKDNHYADALRYALQNLIKGKNKHQYASAGTRTF